MSSLSQTSSTHAGPGMNPPLDANSILANLPHRPPFVFVTTIVDLKPTHSGSGEWHITGHEDFFQGHFPGDPIVPGVLITEALAQLSGLASAKVTSPPVAARLAHVDVKFVESVRPPAVIRLNSTVRGVLGSLTMCDVTAQVGVTVVARGSLTLALSETSK